MNGTRWTRRDKGRLRITTFLIIKTECCSAPFHFSVSGCPFALSSVGRAHRQVSTVQSYSACVSYSLLIAMIWIYTLETWCLKWCFTSERIYGVSIFCTCSWTKVSIIRGEQRPPCIWCMTKTALDVFVLILSYRQHEYMYILLVVDVQPQRLTEQLWQCGI